MDVVAGESTRGLQSSWEGLRGLEGLPSNSKQSSKIESNEICQRTLRSHIKKMVMIPQCPGELLQVAFATGQYLEEQQGVLCVPLLFLFAHLPCHVD